MIGLAAIRKAIVSAWNDHGIHNEFKQLYRIPAWALRQFPELADSPSLIYEFTGPLQPIPFAVYSLSPTGIEGRTSGNSKTTRNELHSYQLKFTIYGRLYWLFDENGNGVGTVSAKQQLSELEKVVLEKFGGHPNSSAPPVQLDIDDAGFLNLQYVSEYYFSPVIKEGLGGTEQALSINYDLLIDTTMVK